MSTRSTHFGPTEFRQENQLVSHHISIYGAEAVTLVELSLPTARVIVVNIEVETF